MIPERGAPRYVALTALMTLVWGLVFGLLDSELDEAGNWLYALAVGAVFAGIIAVADRQA